MKKYVKIISIVLCLSILISLITFFTVKADDGTAVEDDGTVLLNEDFEKTAIGMLPDGWSANTGTGLTASTQNAKWEEYPWESVPDVKQPNRALFVSRTWNSGSDNSQVNVDFTAANKITASFDYQFDSLAYRTDHNYKGINAFTFYSMNSDYSSYGAYYEFGVYSLSTTEGKLIGHNGSGNIDLTDKDGNLIKLKNGIPYHFEITCDTTVSPTVYSYKVTSGDEVIGEGSYTHSKSASVNRLKIQTTGSAWYNENFYIDNIEITDGSATLFSEDFENIDVGTNKPKINGVSYVGDTGATPSINVVELKLFEESDTVKMYNNMLYISRVWNSGNDTSVMNYDYAASKKTTFSFDYELKNAAYRTDHSLPGIQCFTFWSMGGSSYYAYYQLGVYSLSTTEGKLVGHNGSSYVDLLDKNGNIIKIEKDKLYNFEFVCDNTVSPTVISYKVTYEGEVIADGSYTHSSTLEPNRVSFSTTGSAWYNEEFYVDNIVVDNGTTVFTEDFEGFSEGTNKPAINGVTYGGDNGAVPSINVVTFENEAFGRSHYFDSELYVSRTWNSGGDNSQVNIGISESKKVTASFDYRFENIAHRTDHSLPGIHAFTFFGNGGYYQYGVYSLSTTEGKLIAYTGSSQIDLTDKSGKVIKIVPDKDYNFEFTVDTTVSPTVIYYKVTADGELIADSSYTHSNGVAVNRFNFQTTGSAWYNESFFLDNIEITSGTTTLFSEDFDGFASGTQKPTISGVSYVGDTGTVPSIKIVEYQIAEPPMIEFSTKALYLADLSDTDKITAWYPFANSTNNLIAEFDYMLATDEIFSANAIGIGNGGTDVSDLKLLLKVFPNTDSAGNYTGTATLKYYNGTSWSYVDAKAGEIAPNKWYKIKAVIEKLSGTAAIYVNDKKVCDAWVNSAVDKMDRIVFQSNDEVGMGDKFYIDNVKVTTSLEINDDPTIFEDDFSSAIPSVYSFSGSGTKSLDNSELILGGAIRATRNMSDLKSGKFSFLVNTNNVDGLYFGLSYDGDNVFYVKVNSDGSMHYARESWGSDVCLNPNKDLIKTNEWTDITIHVPYDRDSNYAYLYINGQLKGSIFTDSKSIFVNGLFIGAESGTTVKVKDVYAEISDGVLKTPDRTESDPDIYVPEVVDGELIYLVNDINPLTSTLSPMTDDTIVIDKQFTSIGFDFETVQKVNAIRYTTAETDEMSIDFTSFAIYYSNDNENWEKVSGNSYNHLYEDGKWVMLVEFSGVEARYVKATFYRESSIGIEVENPLENIRAERRIERQWKMAGENMVVFGDTAPELTAMTPIYKDELDGNQMFTLSAGDSVGINFGLISEVEAVELIAYGLSTLTVNDIELYISNDNAYYTRLNDVILSRDTRDGKDVYRLTFDSIATAYVKLYIKASGVELSIENIAECIAAYSSKEVDTGHNAWWTAYDGEGDFYTLPNGTLVMTYKAFVGGQIGGDWDDAEILARMSTDGGVTWSPSWLVIDKQFGGTNVFQTRLVWLDNGDLGFIYQECTDGPGSSYVFFRRSTDLGRNWSDPVMVSFDRVGFTSALSSGNCLLRLPNGRLLVFVYGYEDPNDSFTNTEHYKGFVYYTDDNGYTWNRMDGVINLGTMAVEQSAALLENGDILVSNRTRAQGRIFQCISTDGGNTWSQPVAVEGLVTPSSTNTVVTVPATGDVLLLWNNEFATDNGKRVNQSSAISTDHGLTYKNVKTLIEGRAIYPVIQFYGRTAVIQYDRYQKVVDVEEFYYTTEGSVTLADLVPATKPKAQYADGWLTNVSSTMKYSLDCGETWRFCGGTSVQIGEVTGEIWVQDIGTSKLASSDIQIVGENEDKPIMSKTKATLNNDRLTLGSSHVMYNKTAEVELNVTDLGDGEIIIAHGDVDAKTIQGSWLKITKDKLISETTNGKDVFTYLDASHGLDISGKIRVIVRATYDKAVVILETENGQYVSGTFSWLGRNGDIFVEAKNTTVKNVDFSWYCSGYDEDIWFMGDSMFDSSGLEIPSGWPYYAIKDGNTNACWFGWGGRKTEQALAEFKNALNYGTPKYAVWCMGANNEDVWSLGSLYNRPDEWKANATWKAATDEFLAICEEKGITPILATIPNARERINYFKNQVVKSSGYRYIDLSTAVGASDTAATSDWFAGYRISDGLHPTALGAEAMYNQVLKDFPELKSN